MARACANVERILECGVKQSNTKKSFEEKMKAEKLKHKQIRERQRMKDQLRYERNSLLPKLPRSFERLLHLLIKQAILKRPNHICSFFSYLLEKMLDCKIKQEYKPSETDARDDEKRRREKKESEDEDEEGEGEHEKEESPEESLRKEGKEEFKGKISNYLVNVRPYASFEGGHLSRSTSLSKVRISTKRSFKGTSSRTESTSKVVLRSSLARKQLNEATHPSDKGDKSAYRTSKEAKSIQSETTSVTKSIIKETPSGTKPQASKETPSGTKSSTKETPSETKSGTKETPSRINSIVKEMPSGNASTAREAPSKAKSNEKEIMKKASLKETPSRNKSQASSRKASEAKKEEDNAGEQEESKKRSLESIA